MIFHCLIEQVAFLLCLAKSSLNNFILKKQSIKYSWSFTFPFPSFFQTMTSSGFLGVPKGVEHPGFLIIFKYSTHVAICWEKNKYLCAYFVKLVGHICYIVRESNTSCYNKTSKLLLLNTIEFYFLFIQYSCTWANFHQWCKDLGYILLELLHTSAWSLQVIMTQSAN